MTEQNHKMFLHQFIDRVGQTETAKFETGTVFDFGKQRKLTVRDGQLEGHATLEEAMAALGIDPSTPVEVRIPLEDSFNLQEYLELSSRPQPRKQTASVPAPTV